YVVFSRSVPACGKASKRRCSTPTASFDNAVCRQAHFGLSLKNHIVRGFKPEDDILSRRIAHYMKLFLQNLSLSAKLHQIAN
ncbi:MAG: hypothetical protein ABW100_17760, partial [Candidatus Thiodiazotropha sp. 6PLUC3]